MCGRYAHQPPKAWRQQHQVEGGAEAAGSGPVQAHRRRLVRRDRDHGRRQAVQQESDGARHAGLLGGGGRGDEAVRGDEDVGGEREADKEGKKEGGVGNCQVREPKRT